MNLDVAKLIQNDLWPNEEVIWKGIPCVSKVFSKGDVFFVPFSLGMTMIWAMVPRIKSAILLKTCTAVAENLWL